MSGHDTHPRPGTRHPHRARARALKLLFQADLRGQDPAETLAAVAGDRAALQLLDDLDPDEPAAIAVDVEEVDRHTRVEPLDAYTRTLVEGVAGRMDELDQLIGRFAHKWTVARMPVVDRNILRMAVYEILHEDTPPAIVIDEALELAKELAGDRSGPYINGVLESVRRSRE